MSSAQSGDALTYTLSVTVKGNFVSGVTVTDPLPDPVVIQNLGNPTSGAATFNTATNQIGWSLPSPLAPGVYSLTCQVQVKDFVPGGTDIENLAQLTCPGLAAPLTASATVRMTGSYTVKCSVFNEAGELIKTLFLKEFSRPVTRFDLSNKTLSTLTGDGSRIDLTSDGAWLGTWDGTDPKGDRVTNGVYYIKLDNVDPNGVVTTLTQQAIVDRKLVKLEAVVFNEAGEIVRHLMALVGDPQGSQMTNVVLSTDVLQPMSLDAGSHAQLLVEVQTSGAPVTLIWDGTGDSGRVVQPGHYQIQLHWDDGLGSRSEFTKGLLVLSRGDSLTGKVTARPNILSPFYGLTQTTFQVPSGQNLTLKIRIFSLAGEKVASFEGSSGSDQAVWKIEGLASGIYIAVVDLMNHEGKRLDRQTLKVVVVR